MAPLFENVAFESQPPRRLIRKKGQLDDCQNTDGCFSVQKVKVQNDESV